MGIRSMARLLTIGQCTVIRRIRRIAAGISKPPIAIGKEYEVDEMCTIVGSKQRMAWIVIAQEKNSGRVMDFYVGARMLRTLRMVINTLLLAQPVAIHTDRLAHYQSLVPAQVHQKYPHGTNHVERLNLTLRTHLKRLGRRTICFSKRTDVLVSCLAIYFWS